MHHLVTLPCQAEPGTVYRLPDVHGVGCYSLKTVYHLCATFRRLEGVSQGLHLAWGVDHG